MTVHEPNGHDTNLGFHRGNIMGRQEPRGKLRQLQGRGKELVGILTGDSQMELEGDRLQTAGEIQENLGQARRKIGDGVARAAKAIKK